MLDKVIIYFKDGDSATIRDVNQIVEWGSTPNSFLRVGTDLKDYFYAMDTIDSFVVEGEE